MSDRTGSTDAQVRAMLEEMASHIQAGGLKAVTIRIRTTEGDMEHTFNVETEEERTAALLTIRKVLGQVH